MRKLHHRYALNEYYLWSIAYGVLIALTYSYPDDIERLNELKRGL